MRANPSTESPDDDVAVIPPWVIKLLAVLQPVVLAVGSWAVLEMRELRLQVTVLTVQMEYMADSREEILQVLKQVEINSNRISRLETTIQRIEGHGAPKEN